MILAGLALGAGFEVAQQSATAGGTAHAGTARVDAASAWYNPAALADGHSRMALGVSIASVHLHAEALPEAPDAPWAADTSTPPALPPHLYASWARDDLVLGVAVNAPFGGGVDWAPDWPGRFEIIHSSSSFFRIAPFAGYRFGRISLAAGPHLDLGSLDLVKASDHVSEEGRAEIRLSGMGLGADLALLVDLAPLRLGLSYKSRTRLALAGEADFDVPAPFSSDYPDQTLSASWRLPDRLALGFGYKGLYLDLGLTTWAVNDALVLDLDQGEDIVQVNAWRDTLSVRAGAEHEQAGFTFRAGTYIDGIPGSAVPSDHLGPASPDSARVGLTLGLGHALGPLRVDAYGEHLRLLERTSTSEDSLQSRYAGRAWIGGLTLSHEALPRQGT